MVSLLKEARLPHRVVFSGDEQSGCTSLMYTCWLEVPEEMTGGWLKIDSVAGLVRYMANRLR